MHARQLVSHGHIRVNRRKVDIPSKVLNPGDYASFELLPEASDLEQNQDFVHPLLSWFVHDAGTVVLSSLPAGVQDVIAQIHRKEKSQSFDTLKTILVVRTSKGRYTGQRETPCSYLHGNLWSFNHHYSVHIPNPGTTTLCPGLGSGSRVAEVSFLSLFT